MTNRQFEIYFPSTQYNECLGDLRLSKKKIDEIKNDCLKKYGRYTHKHKYIMKYGNMVYEITNHKQHRYYIYESSTTELKNNIIINSFERRNICENDFPILNQYDEEEELNIITFNSKKININIVNNSYVYLDFYEAEDTDIKTMIKQIRESYYK